jgi:hypothetical protein
VSLWLLFFRGGLVAGRPKTSIDKNQLKHLMRLKPSLEDTAAFFECTRRTIERTIRAEYDLTFFEFREQHMVHTRFNIIRKAIEKAESGDNVMLIFCLKNLCGWVNEAPTTVINNNAPKPEIKEESLEDRVKKLKVL